MDLIERLLTEIESIPGPLSRQKIWNRRNEIKAKTKAKLAVNIEADQPADSKPVAPVPTVTPEAAGTILQRNSGASTPNPALSVSG